MPVLRVDLPEGGSLNEFPVKFSRSTATKLMEGRSELYAIRVINFIAVNIALNNLQTP
jgi:hypothetical protein